MSDINNKSDFSRLLTFIKPKAVRYTIGLIGGSLVGASASAFTAFVIQDLLDAALNRDMSLLISAVKLLCLMIIILCLFSPLFGYMFKSSVKKIMAQIRLDVLEHVEGLSAKYFENTHSGEVISRITNDVQVMESAFSDHLFTVVATCVSGVVSAGLMFVFDWRIALVLIFLGIVSAVLNTLFAKPIGRISDKMQRNMGELTERLSDMVNGFSVMKIFNISNIIIRKFDTVNCKITKSSIDRTRISALESGTNFLLGWLNFGGVMVAGSLMALYGTISFGKLAATLQLLNGVTFMFIQIGSFIAQLQASFAGARRVYELLDEPLEAEKYDNETSMDSKSMVDMRDIVFSYDGGKRVLDGISLKAEEEQLIALAGPSGGGKSTVIKLLLGFYMPESGGLVLGGRPITDFSMAEIRELTSYVPQDAYLFEGSIAENIWYGRLEAEMDEVIAAAKAANAHDFIMEQSDGYDTRVGERGVKLSGGQRQRIAIARAILKDAPILLLDEATSALDSESEQMVQEALNKLMKGRTTIAVAHRLSTIENADTIYVIDQGRVVEKGTHAELSKGKGLYNKLCELQYHNHKQEVAAVCE